MNTTLIEYLPYILCIAIICTGLYGTTNSSNYLKKLVSLSILQSGVILFFIAIAKVKDGQIPILACLDFKQCPEQLINPLPHVLMLTAIVVGVATLAVGLALIIRIKEEYGTIEENTLIEAEQND
jgi:multicomponent Na+:H+ antiporter subunit C